MFGIFRPIRQILPFWPGYLIVEDSMKDRKPPRRPHLIRTKPDERGCVTLFTVCLFIVILSVFAWAIHRRLAQYDTILPTMHQSTATKVCLTERTPVPKPSMHGIDGFMLLFEILVLAGTLFALRNSEASLHLRVLRDKWDESYQARYMRDLIHFFFMPPPSLSSAL